MPADAALALPAAGAAQAAIAGAVSGREGSAMAVTLGVWAAVEAAVLDAAGAAFWATPASVWLGVVWPFPFAPASTCLAWALFSVTFSWQACWGSPCPGVPCAILSVAVNGFAAVFVPDCVPVCPWAVCLVWATLLAPWALAILAGAAPTLTLVLVAAVCWCCSLIDGLS